MRAVQYSAYGELPVLLDLSDPVCPPGGAVVAVGATGVCRSDWHAWQGHDPVDLPHVPGHEFAGTVLEVGTGVERWQTGQRVTAPFVQGCGVCAFCRSGDAQVCPDQRQPGFTDPGSFAQRVVVHAADTNLVAVPDGLDDVTAASLGCRFATAYRAVVAHGRIGEGQWLAVHGCGGVGLSAVMVGVALGARVVATDISPAALARAQELGAEVTVSAGPEVGEQLLELTVGGAHVSVDAIGTAEPSSGRCAPCVGGGGMCRSGCCSAPTPSRRCRWTSSSPASSRSMARTGWPRTSTRRCSPSSSRAGCGPTGSSAAWCRSRRPALRWRS